MTMTTPTTATVTAIATPSYTVKSSWAEFQKRREMNTHESPVPTNDKAQAKIGSRLQKSIRMCPELDTG